MRTRNFTFVAAALALSLAATARAQQTVAVVDLEKLIRLHPNTAEDKKQLEATLKDYNNQKDQVRSLAVSTRDAFEAAAREAANPALSEAARKKAEAVAREKRQAAIEAERNAAEKTRELQRDLSAQEMKMLKRTTDEIERAIAAYARNKGIDVVLQLPSRLSPGTGVVYFKPELDITPAIMKFLDIPDEEPEAEDGAAAEAKPAAAKADAPGAAEVRPAAPPPAPASAKE